MAEHRVGETTIIRKDRWAYIAHPSITLCANGDWLAAFNHTRRRDAILHPPDDPLYRTLVCRSKDRGQTWQQPHFAPHFDFSGTECPGIAATSGGTVVLSEFRFAWYPQGLALRERRAGTPVLVNLPEQGWTADFTEEDLHKARYTWARGVDGVYVHLSTDNGRSFERTVKLDCSPWAAGYSRTGVVELSEGRLAYALTETSSSPGPGRTYVLFSGDGGGSWSEEPALIEAEDHLFAEPDIAEIRPGELYCVLRDDEEDKYLFGCRSSDGGRTWTSPRKTSLRGCPGHLLVLEDGRLLCSYGLRERPYGIRACLSEDGGRTWRTEEEILIRDDLPNADLGYPATIEYAPGHLFCCYYGQEPDGVTCVQGTFVDLA